MSSTRPTTTPLQAAAARYGAEAEDSGAGRTTLSLLLAADGDPRPAASAIFAHIPKTGGSTLQRVVRDAHPRAELLRLWVAPASGEPWWTWPPDLRGWHAALVASMTPDEQARLIAAFGHTAGCLLEHLSRPARLVTLVRDPVDRFLSQQSYYAAHRGVDVADRPGDLWRGVLNADNCNPQSRILLLACGVEYGALPVSAGVPPGADRWRQRLFDFLASRAVIGIQSAYAPSLRRFAEAFGWALPEAPKVKKLNPRRALEEDLDASTVAAIRSANWLDEELYGHYARGFLSGAPGSAQQRTEARRALVGQQVGALREKVAGFRTRIERLEAERARIADRQQETSRAFAEVRDSSERQPGRGELPGPDTTRAALDARWDEIGAQLEQYRVRLRSEEEHLRLLEAHHGALERRLERRRRPAAADPRP